MLEHLQIKMGNCTSTPETKVIVETRYERLNKLESVFLRDIKIGHEDYKTAQNILNNRTNNQYGDMMRNAPNMGF